jgi:hypothetical protein
VTRLALIACLLSLPALADILPEEVASCRGKSAGTACTTPEGVAGTCVEQSFTRPDYSNGPPPSYKQVKMLACVAAAKGSARSVLPWLAVGMAFLALVIGMRKGPALSPTLSPAGERE